MFVNPSMRPFSPDTYPKALQFFILSFPANRRCFGAGKDLSGQWEAFFGQLKVCPANGRPFWAGKDESV